jgi:DNA-binding transcriptional regulator YhcF (GntR family)
MSSKLENESVTFRIAGDILLAMRQLSQENGVSINTLVNNVLRSYVDWESIAVKAGFGVFQKQVVKEAISALDQQTLGEIALSTADSYKDICCFS